jgi:cell envelope opacity-associated protein A
MAQYITKVKQVTALYPNLNEENAAIVAKHLHLKRRKKSKVVTEPKTESFKTRLTERELSKLQNYAVKKGISASQVFRNYIRRLPNDEDVAAR